MARRNYFKNNMQRIGRLIGMDEADALAVIKTKRQMLIASVVMIVGVLTFNFYSGTIPLKYTGISINDFSWFWGMM